ncbi:hypothetical protein OH77DRAFT_270182 [Trametes cingulata]|nr:hypothetical protein OH77DRAFT_270182 [Trametes cingulata]
MSWIRYWPPESQEYSNCLAEILRSTSALERYCIISRTYPPRPPTPPLPKRPTAGVQTLRVRTRQYDHIPRLCGAPSLEPDTDSESPVSHAPPVDQQPAPIQALPTELLTEILLLVAASEHPENADSPSQALRSTWMLVCRHWHDSILHTSPFWRQIDASPNLAYVALLLARSRDCTLDLRVLHAGLADPQALALVLPHAHRVRSLSARLSLGSQQFEILRPLFDAGMPALERIELMPVKDGAWRPRMEFDCVSLSATSAPRLRSLVVGDVVLPSPRAFWRGLRVLKLHSFRSYNTWSDGASVLDVLAGNPGLEELYVRYTLHPPATESGDSAHRHSTMRSVVRLPRLRVFSVHGEFSFISLFLPALELPHDIPSFDLRVQCLTDHASVVVPPRMRPILDRMTEVTVIRRPYDHMLTLSAPHDPWPQRARDMLSVTLWSPVGQTLRPVGLQNISHILPLVPVRSLVFRLGGCEASAETWRELFDVYPSLRELQLTMARAMPRDFTTILSGLEPFSLSDSSAGEEQAAVARCPNLMRLSIHTRFVGVRHSRDALEILADCVVARARCGAKLVVLDLHFSHQDEEPLKEEHREQFVRIRSAVELFTVKFGRSQGCRQCR